ncbi:hypothetical protein BJY16_001555 [Actinoplanes octamycinicus]|uniref:Uncharacterized protein n=1 Tax=Actinoplanes octamycinicus TaxID=135948 RepID=A0A7W7GTN4_9ACTN|nr:hypothetical protein [Actinoplanes octamycinicus]
MKPDALKPDVTKPDALPKSDHADPEGVKSGAARSEAAKPAPAASGEISDKSDGSPAGGTKAGADEAGRGSADPEGKAAGSDSKAAGPETKAAGPETKSAGSETKAAGPETKSAGSEGKAADPATKGAGPEDKGAAAGGGKGAGDPLGTAAKGKRKRKELPETRPPGAPEDPWSAFAAIAAEKPPGRLRRGFRVVWRAVVHEYALAAYISAVLAIGLTWPTLRYPMHTLPQDLGDPSRQAWQVSWLGHVLRTNPVKLWQSNAYFPNNNSFAYGDSLLGYAGFGLVGDGPSAAVLRYNIIFVLAHALLLFGAYALVRQLGARPTGAAVAAAAFAYAPWRLAQEGHLDIISAGAIPLALALLARGHGWSIRYGFRPERRRAGWAALGWLVATWQLSLGFSLGLPFAYVLAGIVLFLLVAVPLRRLRRRRRERKLSRGELSPTPAAGAEKPAAAAKPGTDDPSSKKAAGSPGAKTDESAKATEGTPSDKTDKATKATDGTPGEKTGRSTVDTAGETAGKTSAETASEKTEKPTAGTATEATEKTAGEETDKPTAGTSTEKTDSPSTEATDGTVGGKADAADKAVVGEGVAGKGSVRDGVPSKAEARDGVSSGLEVRKERPEKGEAAGATAPDKGVKNKSGTDKADTNKADTDKTGPDKTGTDKTGESGAAGSAAGKGPAKGDSDSVASGAGSTAGEGKVGRRRVRKEKGGTARPGAKKVAAGPRRESRAVLGWRLVLTNVLGVLFFVGVGAVIAIPYLRAPDSPTRTAEIDFFSPPVRSLLIGPAESRIWGAAHATPRASLDWAAEMSLLPGFVLYALALAGLLFSIWRWRQRLFLVLALAAAVILTLGTTFFDGRWTYLPLFGHLPASFDLRIPGRLMLWTTLLLAILAAGAIDEFVRRIEHFAAQRTPPWPSPWLRLATLVPVLLIVLEGWNATAHPVVPAQPAALRTVGGPMLVLPTAALSDQTVQLWTTSRYQQVTNGGGNVAAVKQEELRKNVASFPDLASIQYLRDKGVGTVLLIRSEVVGTPWEQAGDLPVDALGIRREDLPDAVIFRLN